MILQDLKVRLAKTLCRRKTVLILQVNFISSLTILLRCRQLTLCCGDGNKRVIDAPIKFVLLPLLKIPYHSSVPFLLLLLRVIRTRGLVFIDDCQVLLVVQCKLKQRLMKWRAILIQSFLKLLGTLDGLICRLLSHLNFLYFFHLFNLLHFLGFLCLDKWFLTSHGSFRFVNSFIGLSLAMRLLRFANFVRPSVCFGHLVRCKVSKTSGLLISYRFSGLEVFAPICPPARPFSLCKKAGLVDVWLEERCLDWE